MRQYWFINCNKRKMLKLTLTCLTNVKTGGRYTGPSGPSLQLFCKAKTSKIKHLLKKNKKEYRRNCARYWRKWLWALTLWKQPGSIERPAAQRQRPERSVNSSLPWFPSKNTNRKWDGEAARHPGKTTKLEVRWKQRLRSNSNLSCSISVVLSRDPSLLSSFPPYLWTTSPYLV